MQGRGSESVGVVLAFSGLTVGLCGFGYGLLSIRCPRCNTKWLWLAFTERSAGGWLGWLLSQVCCPACKRSFPFPSSKTHS